MLINLTNANVRLEPRREISLHDAAGVELTCLTGQVWMTMEGDTRDITLSIGDQHTIERNGLTLVNAIEPSLVHVRVARARGAHVWRRWLRHIWVYLVRAGEIRAHRHLLSRYYKRS